jgi:hypothetical protein
MSTPIDLAATHQRGLADRDSLAPHERLVYLLVDLELSADMEGWDHFFIHSRQEDYATIFAGLRAAGDEASLAVLQDYERHFHEHGVAFTPSAICVFLDDASDQYLRSCRDWHADYTALGEERWQKLTDSLHQHGYQLIV